MLRGQPQYRRQRCSAYHAHTCPPGSRAANVAGCAGSIGNTKPLFTRAHPLEPPSTPPATTPHHWEPPPSLRQSATWAAWQATSRSPDGGGSERSLKGWLDKPPLSEWTEEERQYAWDAFQALAMLDHNKAIYCAKDFVSKVFHDFYFQVRPRSFKCRPASTPSDSHSACYRSLFDGLGNGIK